MLEGIGTHNGLVGLALHPGVFGHHFAGRGDVHGVDATVQLARVGKLLPSLEGEGHDNFLQGSVTGTLTDAVDGAFQLPGAIQVPVAAT